MPPNKVRELVVARILAGESQKNIATAFGICRFRATLRAAFDEISAVKSV